MRKYRQLSLLFVIVAGLLLASSVPFGRSLPAHAAIIPGASPTLSLEARGACQLAVEEVLWQQRLWPAENPSAKPPLQAVLSAETIRARVDETLRQSNALAERWQQPISGQQLQAELARMAAQTQQPDALRALWGALGNDPLLAAECVARPALVERLIQSAYAQDERLHGALAARAHDERAAMRTVADMAQSSGRYQMLLWQQGDPATAETEEGVVTLDAADWRRERDHLAAALGASGPASLPVGTISALQEDEGGYYVVALLEAEAASLVVATVRWEKQPFAEWWAGERDAYAATLPTPSFLYTLPDIAPQVEPGDWLPTPALPSRTNGTAVWTGTEMLVWGGGSPGTGRSSDGAAYNPATDSWLTMGSIGAPIGRFGHTAVWTGSEMIVWGGCGPYDYSFCELADGARYNPVTDIWTPTQFTDAPSARLSHTAVWTGSEMIVWGGCAPSSSSSSCIEKDTGGRYDPATDSWEATSTLNAPAARYDHTAVWTGSEMIVWGGYDGLTLFNTGGRYNPATNTWIATPVVGAPTGRSGHTAVWTGSEMIVWGGCPEIGGCIVQGTPVNTGGRYNPATNQWTPTSTANAPTARTGHTAVWTGAEMIVWGGGTSNNIYFNTGGRYNPATDTWTPTATTNAPSARVGHDAVWADSVMIVWGGPSATGGRYNPDTNTWVRVSTEDPNTTRSDHVAVWTGAEMIIWGGQDAFLGSRNDGRSYSPITRTWRTIAPVNALGGRYAHTAVWTGTEMIVWGGADGSFTYRDGGRYNPTTDTWQLVSTTGAPASRAWHTAVWTGSEMIVWGGAGDVSSYMQTGGRYNPATNSWANVATQGAPPGRYLFDAVWTGEEMIVWGGIIPTGDTNTGGRYNPATNSWALTTVAGAPVARHYHTAVWTGSEMIVWGGVYDLDNPTNPTGGGRYNPDTDSWTPTSQVDVPAGRVRHTAVWTGSEMIVWGGCTDLYCGLSFEEIFLTGGHYNPQTNTWAPTTASGGHPPRARRAHSRVDGQRDDRLGRVHRRRYLHQHGR